MRKLGVFSSLFQLAATTRETQPTSLGLQGPQTRGPRGPQITHLQIPATCTHRSIDLQPCRPGLSLSPSPAPGLLGTPG
jgi:hypothetical protein